MNNAETPQRFLLKDLPDAKDEQFLLRRLSVHNWGTFSKIHTCNFSEEGSLILGPSGAGKSTLLDAISAMTVPPKKVRFNAAADEGGNKGPDRSAWSYIRGVYGTKADTQTREATKQYLRHNGTVSAIALEYGNRLGRTVTLVRVFWITSAGSGSDVNHAYLVVEGSFDLKALAKLDGDMRKLRSQMENLEGVTAHRDFAGYQDHWCRIMGIEDVSALELLHKAQSTKSVGDLNVFLRQFMLDEPDTFEKAAAFVTEFVELEEAHKAVISARQQIDLLHPAKTHYVEYNHLLEQLEKKKALRTAAPTFVQSLKVDLLVLEITHLTDEMTSAKSQIEANSDKATRLQDRQHELNILHLAAGGTGIQSIEHRIADLIGQRRERSRNKEKAELACAGLDWSFPLNAESYATIATRAREQIERTRQREESRLDRRDKLAIKKHNLAEELDVLRKEIEVLEKSPSNIDGDLRRIRDIMCEELGIPVSKVVFAGELIQVLPDHHEWAPAIERLLGGFGKNMLAHPDFHKRVAQWLDKTNTRRKVGYHPVTLGTGGPRRDARTSNSVIYKIELKDHPYASWVHRKLLDKFDYECVPNAAALVHADFRITREGQIRHSHGYTEKDDRYDIRDRKKWVLGFDSREKLTAYKDAAQEKGQGIADAMRELQALESERQQDGLRKAAAEQLLSLNWISIDVASLMEQIAHQEELLERLRTNSPALIDLDGQIAEVKGSLGRLLDQQTTLKSTVSTCQTSISNYEMELERARVFAGGLSGTHREALRARFEENWQPTLKNVAAEVQKVIDQLNDELEEHGTQRAKCLQKILSAFDAIVRTWKEECSDLQVNIESAPDFFARLQRLEEDGLPQHEMKFQNLLNQLSTQRLAELNTHMDSGRTMIRQKLEDINDALYTVNYNPDSYIRILPVEQRLEEVTAFKGMLAPIFANQHFAKADAALAEEQYARLSKVVKFLTADDAESRRRRERVLDIRQHVEFEGEELKRGTDEQVMVYNNSSGISGGQRQKLTATCLAAALRFKLGGTDGGVPQYGPVVLDEAFTKTDADFTRICLQIFKELGFQLVVATPMKSVQTIEEFIGGAVYVSIQNRKESAVCQIDYLDSDQRLNLSDEQRQEALESEDA